MESPLKDTSKDFETIFSNIGNTEKTPIFSELKNDLSKLRQSVSLLRFYGEKGKINSKKIRRKFISSPKIFQTEPNNIIKASKRNFKRKDFNIKDKMQKSENKINNSKNITNNNLINEMSKTSLSKKGSDQNIFMTNINYKKKNIINTFTNTNYNSELYLSKNKEKQLPNINKIKFDETSSNNNSFAKIKLENKNNFSRNKPVILNKANLSFNKEQFPKITNNMIKIMKKDNNNIKKKINKGIEKFNIMEWYMKTRFKYAQYKFGIAEIQKYFMDLKAYGKPEEEEIEKRKTFFEHVEDIINDIHIVQQQKEIEKLNKKYGIDQDKKKIVKSNKEIKEKGYSHKKQMMELSKALQEIDKRRKKQQKKRQQIEEILYKCKQGVHSINSLDKKLGKKERKINLSIV